MFVRYIQQVTEESISYLTKDPKNSFVSCPSLFSGKIYISSKENRYFMQCGCRRFLPTYFIANKKRNQVKLVIFCRAAVDLQSGWRVDALQSLAFLLCFFGAEGGGKPYLDPRPIPTVIFYRIVSNIKATNVRNFKEKKMILEMLYNPLEIRLTVSRGCLT